MTPRRWRVGVALLTVYAAVAVVTHLAAGGGGRPLFDGFAPPPPYRWVKPPKAFAAGNQQPTSAERAVPVSAQGSDAANASTTDAQVIVTMPQGAIPAHGTDTSVDLTLTPLDPASLAHLPTGLRSVGNVYQITLTYQPSQAPVTQVASSVIVALTAGLQGDTLSYSPDGKTWQHVDARPFGATNGLTGPFAGSGYYEVTASPSVTTTTLAGSAKKSHGGPVAIAIGLAVVVVAAGFGLRAWLRDRARKRRRRQRDRRKGKK